MLLIVDSPRRAEELAAQLTRTGLGVDVFAAATPPAIAVTEGSLDEAEAGKLPGVMRVLSARDPLFSTRVLDETPRVVKVGDVAFGGLEIPVIAGPCSVDEPARLASIAEGVRAAGASMLRAGVVKTRSSPFSFQGRGLSALALLRETSARLGMPVVSEVMSVEDVERFASAVDMLQVGARNMHNVPLLRAVGKTRKPVLLKRGFGSTIEELLYAADYVLAEGNQDVVLCERGIRTFEDSVRFSFDLSAFARLKQRTRLPVVVDPSHAAGDDALVPMIARGAIAAGADGLIIEVHDAPSAALSDGEQALHPAALGKLIAQLRGIATAIGRQIRAQG